MWHALLYWWEGKPVIAPRQVVEWRRDQCRVCPHNLSGMLHQCDKCLCSIIGATLLASKSCPIERWTALDKTEKANNNHERHNRQHNGFSGAN